MKQFNYCPYGNFDVCVKRNNGKYTQLYRLETMREAEEYVFDRKRQHPNLTFKIINKIDEHKAKEFYRNLLGTIHSTGNIGIMSEYLVADHMDMSVERARDMLWACVKFGITDRQGGGFVV